MIEQSTMPPAVGPKTEVAGAMPDISPEHKGKLQTMVEGVGTFIADIGKANELAKGKLDKNTALEQVMKGSGVAIAGVTGELLSDVAWNLASDKLGTYGGGKLKEFLERNTVVREMTENLAIMVGYNWASGQIGRALPSPIPAHYVGLSLAIDAVDKGLLNKVDGKKSGILEYSNAVTDYGIGLIMSGAVTFGKELRAIRKARKAEGAKGIEKLFVAQANAQKEEKIQKRVERLFKVLEGDTDKKNGDAPKAEGHS